MVLTNINSFARDDLMVQLNFFYVIKKKLIIPFLFFQKMVSPQAPVRI